VSAEREPTRLARSDEGLAGRLLRVLEAPPARLSPAARARIAARLDEGAAPLAGARPRYFWPAVVAAALLLFAGGVVGAAVGVGPVRRLFERRVAAPPVHVVEAPRPAPAPVVEAAPAVAPAPAPKVHPRVALAKPAAPPEDPVVAESRLLGEALAALRHGHDPEAALRTLDRYEQRFPTGALALEASAARVDALLALGRRPQALARLEEMPLDRVPRGPELRTLRGELLAGRGDCDGAIADFSAVLNRAGAPASVVERALYGRGSCRSRVGDAAGARADLQDLLRRFPSGPFAQPAARALQ
jgi:hypothetical protein